MDIFHVFDILQIALNCAKRHLCIFPKKRSSNISTNFFPGVTLRRPSYLQLYKKETPTQVFSCKICEIFKNTIFLRTPQSLPLFCLWCDFLMASSKLFYHEQIFLNLPLNHPSSVKAHPGLTWWNKWKTTKY